MFLAVRPATMVAMVVVALLACAEPIRAQSTESAVTKLADSAVNQPTEPVAPKPTESVDPKLRQLVAGVQNVGGTAGVKPQNPRILFITSKDSPHCAEELTRLRRPGGDFEGMQAQGWKIGAGPENHLQIIDQAAVADLVRQIDVEIRHYPVIICISGEEIVRSFRTGCTTPLDAWTFGWLAKGVNERPEAEIPEAARVETTGHFPLRGNHWSIDEEWYPTRERVIFHLRNPPHASQLNVSWEIETWSYEELRSVHDYLHEQVMGGIQYGNGHKSKPAKRGFSKN